VNSTALAHQPAAETTLTLLTGGGRGTIYRLVSNRVRIGRGPDNDIVINDDPKVSRHHVEVVVTPRGIEVRDVTDRNVILVDGLECKAALINDNSVFTLGDSQFRLSIRAQLPQPAGWNQMGAPRTSSRARKSKTKSSPMRWIIGAIVVAVVWIGLTDTKKEVAPSLTDEQRAEAEMKTAQELKTAAEARRPKVSPTDVGYNQAQQAFVAGFRDYRKGQFERAVASFQACVSLYPSHDLCNRYLRLTQRRVDELVQHHMVVGRKYRDQNQFGACRAAFRNVMVMVKDPTSKRYLEAKANYEACNAQLEERF
jgi:pSer/pThr/pTyr-binding forkhead associated (FHA) protein